MNHEELIHEYEALTYQLFGKSRNGSGMSYTDLAAEVSSLYAFFNDLNKGALK